jgi:hypothetical protein
MGTKKTTEQYFDELIAEAMKIGIEKNEYLWNIMDFI